MSRLPANTSQAIKKARLPGAQHDRQEVQAIVLALEYPNSMVCKRLDSLSLTILCSIFMSSQECLAQQRGLCLLAVSSSTTYTQTITHYRQEALHWDNPDSAQKIAHNQAKKIAMGQAALTLLIKGFLNTEASDKLRRWVGISYRPDGLLLTFLPAWNTCIGTSRRLPRKYREAPVGSN